MITMIDYGGSNLRSAQKAFEFIGAEVLVTEKPDDVLRAVKLVLPGVGAFGAGMAALRARGLVEPIRQAVANGVPLLGICVGMQFLFDVSEEMGKYEGLGVMPGRVVRFPEGALKVPHMGWNELVVDRPHPLLWGVPAGAYTYFVHSYHCQTASPDAVVAHTDYGQPVAAIVQEGNVYGIQFHPEKSHRVGLQIINNYVTRIPAFSAD